MTGCAVVMALVIVLLIPPKTASGQDATWVGTTSDWNTPSNWSPTGQPTGTAIFDSTGITKAITFSSSITSIGGLQFNSGAANYSFTLPVFANHALVINGSGINSAANADIISSPNSGATRFLYSSTAGSATITNQFILAFENSSTAGDASITNSTSGLGFGDTSTAGFATIKTVNCGTYFLGLSTGG